MKGKFKIAFVLVLMAISIFGCAQKKKFHIVKKESTHKILKNSDNVYYYYNYGMTYVWVPNSYGYNSGASFSYNDAYKSDIAPSFSSGNFIPVTDAPAESSPVFDNSIVINETAPVSEFIVENSIGDVLSSQEFSSAIESDSISETAYDSQSSFESSSDYGSSSSESSSFDSGSSDFGSSDSGSFDSGSSDFGGGDCSGGGE